ncbi:DUF3598 family protein [Baaleninema simplex]|uniref:DUF3598 family protein n=1 Tax=Baaleninema simplex TaxID=2862350 RepID=UPI00034B1715|nr:DUF3598 family protein [Baaleninema simplex]
MTTSTQWQYFLRNLGAWKGSFTQLSPRGEILSDTPTLVTFEGLDDNQLVKQQVFKYPPGEPEPPPLTLEYRTLGRNILFFEDGAFSIGSVQFSPIATFGAELGLIYRDRRMRIVELFAPSGELSGLTLIRECLEGRNAREFPPLTVEKLIGEWEGTVTTMYPDYRNPEVSSSRLSIRLNGTALHQHLQTPQFELSSTGRVEGSRILFESGKTPMQVLLLPDGASCNTPLKIPRGLPFLLESGWLVEENLRYRLVRSYDATGQWTSLTQIVEKRLDK